MCKDLPTKKCVSCEKEQYLYNFSRDTKEFDQLQNQCKFCDKRKREEKKVRDPTQCIKSQTKFGNFF